MNGEYLFEIGDKVVFEDIIGIIESRSFYEDGMPCYGLVAEEDKELSCSAAEDECVLYEGQEVDQCEALSNAKLSSAMIAHQVESITDKYFRDGNH